MRKKRGKETDEERQERKDEDAQKAADGEIKLDAMVRRSIELHGP